MITMTIGTFESAEKALSYLGRTDDEHGRLKAHHQALDKVRKSVRAQCFLEAEGSIADRNSKAESDPRYKKAVEEWENAMADFYTIDAKRATATLAIEIYRSVNSSLKRGNIS